MGDGIGVRVRVTAVATLIVAVAVTLAGVLLVRTVEHALEHHVQVEGSRQLAIATSQLEAGVRPDDIRPPPGSQTFVQVLDASGHAVGKGAGLPGLSVVYGTAGDGASPATVELPLPEPGGSAGAVQYLVRSGSAEVGGNQLTVVTASSLADVERSVATLKQYLTVGLPFLIALVAVLAWFVVGRALRPVEAMRAEVEAISASTIHRRVPEPARQDELGRLARTMNAMLDRLEQGARRQREFVSDASHELRSPMAVIRTKVEVAQRRGAKANWPAVADAVLAEEARLEALVADLLALAREDEVTPRSSTLVDLAAVAEEEAGRDRRRPVRCTAAPTEVRGEARALRSLVAHLLDNAARHARRHVDLSVQALAGQAVLTVDDDGAGIAPEDRERVFERFVRLDASRARDRGGAGLGLAVVRAIARAHGGDAEVHEAPGGGARVVARLPLAEHRATS
jgi:signal transduction histidine kinase